MKYRRAVWIILFLAVGIRLTFYLWRFSFWGDELALLISASQMSFKSLFTQALYQSHAAPPLFLAIQRALAISLGTGEYTQRLPALFWGIASLPLAYALGRRMLSGWSLVLFIAFIGFCDVFVFPSITLRAFSGDVFWSMLLTFLALDAIEQRRLGRFACIGILAALAVWISYPVILIFPALSAIMLWRVRRNGIRSLVLYAVCNMPFLASFAALYLLTLRHQGQKILYTFWWPSAFPDWSHPLRAPWWLVSILGETGMYPMLPMRWLGVPLLGMMIAGGVAWWRGGKRLWLSILLAPMVTSILAAAVHEYPFAGRRVNLYLQPGLLILAAAGVAWLHAALGRQGRLVAVAPILGLLFALGPLGYAVTEIIKPRPPGNYRPVVDYLRAHRRPGEPIYVAEHPLEFAWYWPDAPPPVIENPPETLPDGRFWYVFSTDGRDLARQLDYVRRLSSSATELDRFTLYGGGAVCFQRR